MYNAPAKFNPLTPIAPSLSEHILPIEETTEIRGKVLLQGNDRSKRIGDQAYQRGKDQPVTVPGFSHLRFSYLHGHR